MLLIKRLLVAAVILGATSLFAGCRDSGSSHTAASDIAAPSVLSVTPADGETGVKRNAALTASFSEDMLGTSISDSTFTITGSRAVNGTVSFNGVTNVATFTPDADLPLLTAITATLSNEVADLSGNPLAADYNWRFTTRDGRS